MFGELRALLARQDNQERWRQDASALLVESYTHDPQRHVEQWVPYLQRHTKRWMRPLVCVSQATKLEQWRAIAPFATFELEYDASVTPALAQYIDELGHGGLRQVHELRIERAHLTCTHLSMLLDLPHLEEVRHVSLPDNKLSDEGVQMLASCPRLNLLQGLILYSNKIGSGGARAVFHSSCLTALSYLSLSTNPLGLDGQSLGVGEDIVDMRLHHLLLNNCLLGDDAASEIAGAQSLSALRVLSLKWNPIGVAGRSALTGSPFLSSQVKRGCLG